MKRILSFGFWFLAGALAARGEVPVTNAVPMLSLDEAQSQALHNHPQVAAADYRALAAQEVVKESRAGFFPAANLYGTAALGDTDGTRITGFGLTSPRVYDKVAGGLGLTQLLTDFGKTANLTASSRLNAQAEQQNAAASREQVLLQVDQTYFGALQAQAVLQVARQTLQTRMLLLDQVNVLASNKLKSELDVSFAQVALEEGRLLEQRAQNDAAAAMASLSTALGYREFHEFQLVDQAPASMGSTQDVSGLVANALRQRPELLSLRNEEESAVKFASAQRDSRLPTLSAVGVVGGAPVRASALEETYAAGGVELSMPLFAGGLYLARQHEAELRAHADSELLRNLEDIVVRDVRIAWLNLNNAQQQLRTTDRLLVHANEAFNLAETRYKVGSSSIVELSQAQLELTSAQIANTSARYDVLIQQAKLDYETGAMTANPAARFSP